MDLVSVRQEGKVLTLSLNRVKSYNALSQSLIEELLNQLSDFQSKYANTRAVIIKGNGPGFSAGHDLKEIISQNNKESYESLVDSCSQLMLTLRTLPVPVIASVHGVATAAGCQLVASCDLAYAAASSRFATPGVMIGLFCTTPMVPLSRSIHPKAAMEMLLTGDMISAPRAKEIGLINDYVDDDQLDQKVESVVSSISKRSLTALKFGKKTFYEQLPLSESDAYKLVGKTMVENLLHKDAQEGINAFLEKRPPRWDD